MASVQASLAKQRPLSRVWLYYGLGAARVEPSSFVRSLRLHNVFS